MALFYPGILRRNVSIFDGQDACSKGTWEKIEIPATDGSKDVAPAERNISESEAVAPAEADKPPKRSSYLSSLKPWTQYAFYVEAVTIKSK